jgi:hypothetical protein
MKSINVMIDETYVWKGKEGRKYLEEWVNKEDLKEQEVEEEGEGEEEEEEEEEEEKPEKEQEEDEQHIPHKTPIRRVQKNHPPEHIIGNKYVGAETQRRILLPEQQHLALLSTVEARSFEEDNKDEHCIKVIDREE